MFLIRLFFLVFGWFCSSLYAVEFIRQQDAARCGMYDSSNRDKAKALPFTSAISARLTNHSKIDYNRTATQDERRTIYKAMMGSAIVHNASFESFYKKSMSTDFRYNSYFEALRVIEGSIKALWQAVLRKEYIHSVDKLTTDSRKQVFLTPHFVKWFYEALESYQHELNFFGGTATLEWFQQVNLNFVAKRKSLYNLETEYCSHKKGIVHFHIHDEQDYKMAVIKCKKQEDQNRRNDWVVSLAAKAAGLIDVINPAIPVKVEGKELVIDPTNFTFILEPFVGVRRHNSFQDKNINDLLHHVLEQDEKEKGRNSCILTQKSFAKYFENQQLPSEQRFKDLQTFNRSLDVGNILKLIAFWQIFKIKDMHIPI